ncbi:MAG TPA: hypothetical protein VNE42_09715 [Acidimicrobiales bacterium]|nr:hypothetical protein [Acidimicrobiales bacterium]
MDEFWIAAGSIATAIMASGTLYLAFKTRKLADATIEMASETKKVAEASKHEADATLALALEAQRDRELAWRSIVRVVDRNFGTISNPELRLENLGSGPALDVVWLRLDNPRWTFVDDVDLKAGSEIQVPINSDRDTAGGFPIGIIDPIEDGKGRKRPHEAILCEDLLGTRWRFLPGWPPERYRLGDPNPPRWAMSPFAWRRSGITEQEPVDPS